MTNTELKIGQKIETIRYTDNSDIYKTLTITNNTGSTIEFAELKGKYKIFRSAWDPNKITFNRNEIYITLINKK